MAAGRGVPGPRPRPDLWFAAVVRRRNSPAPQQTGGASDWRSIRLAVLKSKRQTPPDLRRLAAISRRRRTSRGASRARPRRNSASSMSQAARPVVFTLRLCAPGWPDLPLSSVTTSVTPLSREGQRRNPLSQAESRPGAVLRCRCHRLRAGAPPLCLRQAKGRRRCNRVPLAPGPRYRQDADHDRISLRRCQGRPCATPPQHFRFDPGQEAEIRTATENRPRSATSFHARFAAGPGSSRRQRSGPIRHHQPARHIRYRDQPGRHPPIGVVASAATTRGFHRPVARIGIRQRSATGRESRAPGAGCAGHPALPGHMRQVAPGCARLVRTGGSRIPL